MVFTDTQLIQINSALQLKEYLPYILAIIPISAVITFLVGVGLGGKKKTDNYQIIQPEKSGNVMFTYEHQINNLKFKYVSTVIIHVPDDKKIKLDEFGREIPGDKARFMKWIRKKIKEHRHHQDIDIINFEAIEDLKPNIYLDDPNSAFTAMDEQQIRAVEFSEEYQNNLHEAIA